MPKLSVRQLTENMHLLGGIQKRISAIGIELQQSAGLERKRKQALNKAAHVLYDIGMLFQSRDISVKEAILQLILNTHPTLQSTLNFYDAICPAVRKIYNVAKPTGYSITETGYGRHLTEDAPPVSFSKERITDKGIPKYIDDFFVELARKTDLFL